MKLDTKSGLIADIPFRPSPNYDVRPAGTIISLLVIHCISLPPGEFIAPEQPTKDSPIDRLFMYQADNGLHRLFSEGVPKVSTHFFIRRNGEITQYVATKHRAWHAGVSQFNSKNNCNDFSLGIELEGYWENDTPYEAIQYQQLAELTRALLTAYPAITFPHNIVAHSAIALPHGRRHDPGSSFDWEHYHRLLAPAP